jgi:hypothetical protein
MNLGKKLRASDCNGDGFEDLIVLSPLAESSGDQRGNIAVFLNLDKLNKTSNILTLEDADFFMYGANDYEWFGYDALCTPD